MGDINPETQYSEILIKKGISEKISKVEISIPQNLIGEHFGSICESVTITFEGSRADQVHLFVKKMLPVTEPTQVEMMRAVMRKEGYFLTTLREDLQALCIKKLGKGSSLELDLAAMFPKTYHADESIIVLEDILKRGFKMIDKNVKQDFEHATLVMRNLAKLHGVSHVLIQENGGGRSAFLDDRPELADWFLKADAEAMMSAMMNPTLETIYELLEESDVPGSSELLAKLQKYRGKWFTLIIEALTPESLFPVVNHGDAWNNNMMVSYGEDGKLDQVIFYDMQGSRVGPPAGDLAYFLYTSVQPPVRKQWKTLLESYFQELEVTLAQFDYKLPLTFDDFLKEFGQVCKLGLVFGFIMGIGMDAMKNHDTDKMENLAVFEDPNSMRKLVTDFIARNPEKVHQTVLNIISLAEDYEEAAGPL